MLSQMHSIMGVINITPNSFSDGGHFNQSEKLATRVKHLRNWEVSLFDIGAESTAPFNQAISSQEELSRFEEVFFPVVKENLFNEHDTLSIDTYRFETFKVVYDFLRDSEFKGRVVWNDVSGIYSDGVFDFLKKETPDAFYIYCHNNVEERLQSSSHMDFVKDYDSEDRLLEELRDDFKSFVEQAHKKGMAERIWLDPCFGFAKSLEQNMILLRNLEKVFIDTDIPVLLGISRKSFLKKAVIENHPTMSKQAQLDALTGYTIKNHFLELKNFPVIHRVHEPAVVNFAHSLHLLDGLHNLTNVRNN